MRIFIFSIIALMQGALVGAAPAQGEKSLYGSKSCAFAVVATPAKMSDLVTEGITFSSAYTTPSCKTVAIAFTKQLHEVVIARFQGEKLDTSFGTGGSSRFAFFTNRHAQDLHLQMTGGIVVMSGVAASTDMNTYETVQLGFYVAQLSPEGDFNDKAYDNGFAYSSVWARPFSGSSCVWNYLDYKSTQIQAKQLVIHGEYSSPCDPKVYPVDRTIGLVKPVLDHLHVAVPASCQNYNYKSPGAVNSEVYELKQTDCSSITFDWNYIGWGASDPSRYDHFVASTDGTCLDTVLYGRTCFTYEKGYLTRTYVTPAWTLAKQYYAVVNATGFLCSIDGVQGMTLITSSYLPEDPKFTQVCIPH